MVVRAARRLRRPVFLIPAAAVILVAAGTLWLGPGPAPHSVTRDMAVKIAVTHLLQPDQFRDAHLQEKLVRRWQVALVGRNERWSNDLVWLVLVPGGHFAATGACCSPPPTHSWNVAMINDDTGGAGLDGVAAGSPGDAPLWFGLLPDLSHGGQ